MEIMTTGEVLWCAIWVFVGAMIGVLVMCLVSINKPEGNCPPGNDG